MSDTVLTLILEAFPPTLPLGPHQRYRDWRLPAGTPDPKKKAKRLESCLQASLTWCCMTLLRHYSEK